MGWKPRRRVCGKSVGELCDNRAEKGKIGKHFTIFYSVLG